MNAVPGPVGSDAVVLRANLLVPRPDFDVSLQLEVEAGRTVALLGPNGAGKSTAVGAIAGLEPLVDGSILLDSQTLEDVASGVRLGTPAMTTRGFKENEARMTANLVADVLDNPHDEANIAKVRGKVSALTREFPVYK